MILPKNLFVGSLIIGKIRNMSMLSKIVFSLCNIFQYFLLLFSLAKI